MLASAGLARSEVREQELGTYCVLGNWGHRELGAAASSIVPVHPNIAGECG